MRGWETVPWKRTTDWITCEQKRDAGISLRRKTGAFVMAVLQEKLRNQRIDVTLPGRPISRGTKHPLTLIIEQIEDIFTGLGFEIAEGPEMETDYYNFEALNLPKDHPARDMQDTFILPRIF